MAIFKYKAVPKFSAQGRIDADDASAAAEHLNKLFAGRDVIIVIEEPEDDDEDESVLDW